jgi:hypothetical protein
MLEEVIEGIIKAKLNTVNTVFIGTVASVSGSRLQVKPDFKFITFDEEGAQTGSAEPPIVFCDIMQFSSGNFSVSMKVEVGSKVLVFALQKKGENKRSFSLSDCVCIPFSNFSSPEDELFRILHSQSGLKIEISEYAPSLFRLKIGNEDEDLLDIFDELLDQIGLTVAPSNLPALAAKALELKLRLATIKGL